MRAQLLFVIAFATTAGAVSAQAREVGPGGNVEVACAAENLQMAAITSAVESRHYWAPQSARRKMLSLAQQACARGARVVTFEPPADQRSCQTPPTWSTLCVDETATAREGLSHSALP